MPLWAVAKTPNHGGRGCGPIECGKFQGKNRGRPANQRLTWLFPAIKLGSARIEMPGFVILLVILFVILIAVGAYFSHLREQQRKKDLAALAIELGWTFLEAENYDFGDHYPQFDCFQSGSSRYAYNLLTGDCRIGEAAWPAVMGDYHYETESRDKDGKTTTHHHYFSFLVVELPYANTPSLFIRREGVFDWVKRALGFDDIDFESAEFSKRFFVKSSDK
jgi:hypothetical protein